MFFHKVTNDDGTKMLLELYEDEIVTYCPTCNKEYQLEPEEIADFLHDGADFSGTSIYCKGCYKPPLEVVK